MVYKYKTGGRQDGKWEMTIMEFTKFFKTLDTDNDGRISPEELAQAVRNNGGWFCTWKGNRGVKAADSNGNGFIDKDEFPKLVAFAEKELNVKIVE